MIVVQDAKIGRVMSVHKFLTNFVRYYDDVPMNSYDYIRRTLRSAGHGVEVRYKDYVLSERFFDNKPPSAKIEENEDFSPRLDFRFNR